MCTNIAITWTSGCEPSVKIAQDMAADVVSWPWKELLKYYFQHFILISANIEQTVWDKIIIKNVYNIWSRNALKCAPFADIRQSKLLKQWILLSILLIQII